MNAPILMQPAPEPGDTILIVGHGSREDSGNREIRDITEQWRARQPAWRIELCFIEFAPPELNAALLAAARSSRRVFVVPLILNAAGHVKMEIPEAVEGARAACPQAEILMAPRRRRFNTARMGSLAAGRGRP